VAVALQVSRAVEHQLGLVAVAEAPEQTSHQLLKVDTLEHSVLAVAVAQVIKACRQLDHQVVAVLTV
jgi:hypothetical protein